MLTLRFYRIIIKSIVHLREETDSMLSDERQRIILERAQREGQVLVTQLAAEFNVSDETIRRDIHYLNEINALKKVHGGAVPIMKNAQEGIYEKRTQIDCEEKRIIGSYAVRFIEDNDVVVFDSGATLDWLASAINGLNNITIIVNSVSALNILIKKRNSGCFTGKIIFLGGEVDCQNCCTSGSLTQEILNRFHVDKAFISTTAISEDGIQMYDMEDGIYTGLLVKKAPLVHLLCASSKYGKKAFYQICGFSDIQHVITDDRRPLPENVVKAIHSSDTKLHIASSGSSVAE